MKRLTLLLFVFVVGCGTSTPTEDGPVTSTSSQRRGEEQREVARIEDFPDAISVEEFPTHLASPDKPDRVKLRGIVHDVYSTKDKSDGYKVYLRLYSPTEAPRDQWNSRGICEMASIAELNGLCREQEVVVEGGSGGGKVRNCKVLAVGTAEELPALAPVMTTSELDDARVKLEQFNARRPEWQVKLWLDETGLIPEKTTEWLHQSRAVRNVFVARTAKQPTIDFLATLPLLARLELSVDFNEGELDLSPLSRLQHLTSIQITGAGITNRHIEQLRGCKGLRNFRVSSYDCPELTGECFREFEKQKFLRWFSFKAPIELKAADAERLANCSRLLKIELGVNELPPACLAKLSTLPELHSLEFFGGSDPSFVTDNLAAELSRRSWPQLRTLSLWRDQFTPDGFKQLLQNPWPRLTKLELHSCNVPIQAIDLLAASPPPKLKWLMLGRSEIPMDKALRLLAIPTLTDVDLDGASREVSEKLIEAFTDREMANQE